MQPRLAPRLGKENAVSHRSVVVWLFGVIFCFQVVYHVMMHTALLREEVAAHCSDALGSENSPHCIEAKIFTHGRQLHLNLSKPWNTPLQVTLTMIWSKLFPLMPTGKIYLSFRGQQRDMHRRSCSLQCPYSHGCNK